MATSTRETKACAGQKNSSTAMLEEFVPPSAWSQDSDCHYLVLDLPGFKREEVRLQVNNRGEIITSGEKQRVGNKLVIRFLETFKIPKNSIPEKITGKFEGEALYVIIPKRIKDDNIKESSNIDGDGSVKNLKKIAEKITFNGQGILKEDWSITEDSGLLLQSAVKNLKENKVIIITAVFAFSLGVFVARRLSK